ncbi:MAG: endonuclease MutS2 [Nitrospirae bacterium]|nr:endonuclease MutS2 [Nitrospirota bacterium]
MIPQNSLISLEFNKLLEIIAQYAKSDASKSAILNITPLSNKQEIENRFACIEDIMRMSQKAMPLDILPFRDIEPLLQKVQPKDAVPEAVELVWLMELLSSAYNAATQIRVGAGLKPAPTTAINELIKNLTGMPELLNILKRSIDKDGGILDSASPELSELRREKRRIETKIRKSLEDITRDENTAVFLQDNFITQRSGRWVIPVRMDSKGHVQGVVHDVSRTGETAFIEPISIIGLSNELENIIADEKAEEIRILKELGLQIRKQADEIKDEFRTLVYLDMLKSIAMFADRFRMQIPEINEQSILKLSKARHPLLLYSAVQKNRIKDVVPIDVNIGEDKSVMVITGPNAGGKTVTIKTIGLLSVMALSGMPVPADSSITIPLFHNLLVDIGDRQSIADNLSTFTAHLSNMMEFLKKADSSTLVLIDELGTGTDPEEGAALACAILKELKGKGSLIFATTHLTDIKVFAHKTEGMANASMEFDHKTLAPLYRLRIGEPGQSFAIETAKRYGMPESIIESARIMLGKGRAELENLLHDLEQKRRHYENSVGDIKKHERELTEREEKLQRLLKDAEAKKKEIFAKAQRRKKSLQRPIKRYLKLLQMQKGR